MSWARSCRIRSIADVIIASQTKRTIERSIAYACQNRNAGSPTVFCASAPSHQVYRWCALWGESELFQRLAMRGSCRSGTCEATGKCDRSVAGPARAGQPVKLESLAAMMRTTARHPGAATFALRRRRHETHAVRKNIVSSRTDTEDAE